MFRLIVLIFFQLFCHRRVYLVRQVGNNTRGNHEDAPNTYAVKVFDLTNEDKKIWVEKCLKNEMFIGKYLKHPNIVFTFDVMKTPRNGYIVMQYAPNGDLSTECYKKLKRAFTEEEAKNYFRGRKSCCEDLNSCSE